MKTTATATVAQLPGFGDIIDVRSPGEFAQDHIPGAINCPVLDDAERAEVGTLYKQVSAFHAKVRGAALVSRNIARHIETVFADKPRDWAPLVYCWRGGNRSGAMAHVLSQIGWRARQLEGGYKAYRAMVVGELEVRPQAFDFRIVCGPTGSAKSRLLTALKDAGEQVLDLEGLARHRGSLLGDLPDAPQPSQKMFESQLLRTLAALDPSRPVYAEAESKKIGQVQVPTALIERMWQGQCVRIEAEVPARVRFLKEDYVHFLDDPERIIERMSHLTPLHGRERINGWNELARRRDWDALVERLLVEHYDPAYGRSIFKHYGQQGAAVVLAAGDLGPADLRRMAEACVRLFAQKEAAAAS